MRLDRPVGILLLLWPTLWALWFAAGGVPPISLLLIFGLGVVLTRSAGCVVNDYADRWLDGHVKRTRDRPLATGELSGREALLLFAGLMLAAFALVCLTNRLTMALSVGALLLATLYPYAKRHTYYPQFVLGAAFSMGIPMAYTAMGVQPDVICALLIAANLAWTVGYDTLYAMVDREDDLMAGAKSTAILLGDLDLAAVGVLSATCVLALAFVGQRAGLGWPYWLSLTAAAVLFCVQLWIARGRQPASCFAAFRHNQWVGAAIWVGIAVALALKP